MGQFDEFDKPINQGSRGDGSFGQQIILNEIHRSLALDCATFFLKESVARLNLISELPCSPLMIATHALIAHNEWMHDCDRGRLDESLKAMSDLGDSIKDIGGIIDALSNNTSTYSKNIVERLDDVVESIDCAGTKTPDFWMFSDVAAKEKVELLGLSIPPEWTMADLRYKLHQAIYGGENG
jgi:hypothetical protein